MAGVAGFAAPPRDTVYALALAAGAPDGAATTMRLVTAVGT